MNKRQLNNKNLQNRQENKISKTKSLTGNSKEDFKAGYRAKIAGSWRRLLQRVKLALASTCKLFFRYFIIAIAWGAGIVILILFIGLVISSNTILYRGAAFTSQPKWKLTKIIKHRNNNANNVNNTLADIIDGWEVQSVSSAFEPLADSNAKEVALVKMSGAIMPSCYSHNVICPDVVEDLTDYLRNNRKIKGVVILLNSPGGEVYSSEAIYHTLKKLSRTKPVYIFIESEDASGAYYISMGATKIYANPVSIIGSIGVYMEVFNYDGLLQKLGIKHKYIVSKNAKYKLANEWLFNDSKDGKQVQNAIQDVINETEHVFWDRVKGSRPQVQLENLHGLIFSATKAKQLGLIDGIEDQPVNVIIDMLNMQGLSDEKYTVVEYSLNHLGAYKGISVYLHRFLHVLGGGAEYYLMWK